MLARTSRTHVSMRFPYKTGGARIVLRHHSNIAYRNTLRFPNMTSYPFERVWHRGRGIVFSPTRQQESVHSRTYITMESQGAAAWTQHPKDAIVEQALDDEADCSDSGNESFTTAVEYDEGYTAVGPVAGQRNLREELIKEEGLGAAVSVDTTISPKGPPVTSLAFNISAAAFAKAQQAPAGTPDSYWSHTFYRGRDVDGLEQNVKVHYCKSKHKMERVCQYFLDEKVLGFDLEWQPSASKSSGPRRNVSLIQLASPSRIALFHVALFPGADDDLMAPTFRQIMEDPDVTKAGVNIKGDCTRLRNWFDVGTRGTFELSNLYKLVKHSTSGRVDLVNKRLVSLATQVQDCLGLPMFKGPDVRSSDWSQALNMQQITYSAGDAYAGLQLYHVLDEQRMALTPRPPLPYHVEYNLPIRLAPGVTIPSPEELAELATPVQATATASGSMTPAASTMTAAAPAAAAVGGGGVTRQPAAIDTSQQATTQSTSASASAPPLSRSPWGTSDPTRNMDARVLAAESRVATYRASKTSMRTTPTSLRSYYLWHDNEGVGPEEVASILRVPPLQTNTVVGYVLEAIKLENLPFDKKRLRNEVLHLLPRDVMERRYPAIFKAAHQVDVAAGKSESDYAAAKSGWPL
ncbi:Werner syndrome ATP-dependent helicase like protein [Verticillium longisporum]|nr:Werner syndrome ATP-dependent helicase like protein [Verticillium longisporum]